MQAGKNGLATIVFMAACGSAFFSTANLVAAESPQAPKTRSEAGGLRWGTNYRIAMDQAERQGKLLLIYFYDSNFPADAGQATFERKVLTEKAIRGRLGKFVPLLLPTDAKITLDGKPVELLKHAAFFHMRSLPGVAIIDMAHPKAPYFRDVVSAFPFEPGRYYDAAQMKVILTLPEGTLTQRTLTYAVRTYPDRPESADGKTDPVLVNAAQEHSQLMADIQVQGHHNWETRFHLISAKIGDGLEPTEVAAESWPDQPLVEAAVECVYSWRRSSGHWDSVSKRHPIFGYDMKRGRNGIWYATGIFGRRR